MVASTAEATSAAASSPECTLGWPSTVVNLQKVLDLYPKEALRTINHVKMKHGAGHRCLLSADEEPVKFEDANTEESWCRAMREELGVH